MTEAQNSLNIAVVGHTNTGKTSLIRTLLQDTKFGEVDNRAGTTRHVEVAALHINHRQSLHLYDTPGMEDAIALLDSLNQTGLREQSVQIIEAFLASEAAQQEFEQEAKVLRQVLKSHLAIYVIDAREPVLGKYRDELQLLSLCGKPVLPMLNFVAQQNLEQQWREVLQAINLHVIASFDTVMYNFDHEQLLFDQIKILHHAQASLVSQIQAYRKQQWQQKCYLAKQLIAASLIDFAAWREKYRDENDTQQLLAEYQQTIRAQQQQILQAFLQIYQFPEQTLAQTNLEIRKLNWEKDIFDTELWMQYGLDVGSSIAKGGSVGFTLDLLTGGLSLGAGTLLGAGVGLLLNKGQEWKAKFQGYKVWRLSDEGLLILMARHQQLLTELSSRGHAALQVIHLQDLDFSQLELPSILKKAKVKPHWSSLNDCFKQSSSSRASAIESLIEQL